MAWRALLTREVRAAILHLAELGEVGVEPATRELRVTVAHAHGAGLIVVAEAAVAVVVALATAASERPAATLLARLEDPEEEAGVRAAAVVALVRSGWQVLARDAARDHVELAIALAAEGAPEDLDAVWQRLRDGRLGDHDAARAGALLARFDAIRGDVLEPHLIATDRPRATAAPPPPRDVVAALATALLLVGTPAGAAALAPLGDIAPVEVAEAVAAIRERHASVDVGGRLALSEPVRDGALSLDDDG